MNRRQLLKTACAGTAGLIGSTTSVGFGSAHEVEPPGVAWQRTYDELEIAAVASAHDGGHVFVGRGRGRSDPEVPIRVVTVDESGAVRQRQEIDPDVPEEANRASADVIRTKSGYAVASGSWFATLDADLSVETTGFAAEYKPNSTTYLTELSDGFAVAAELDRPNHVSVRAFWFDRDGDLQWVREYGEQSSKWLEFLLDGPDGGVVVGGRGGDPWLASLTADGTERWQTTVTDTLPEVGYDAKIDGDGIVLFGKSNMIRVTDSLSVEWERPYDSSGETSGGKLVQTQDGDYVTAAQVASDRVLVGGVDWKGRPLWSHQYTVVESGRTRLNDVVEVEPGEYLLVGSKRETQEGWALHLSGSETVTTRTATDAEDSGTDTTSEKAMDDATETHTSGNGSTTETDTSVPGFGIGAALVGTAVGLLARRR